MRIIGGRWRGRRLERPADNRIRPSSDRLREALFNRLEHARWAGRDRLVGASVLDAFCGTGALGLEALSRGAAKAVFMDRDRAALALAERNAATLGAHDECRFLCMDATQPPAGQPAGLILLDPPYAKQDGDRDLAASALAALRDSGWIDGDSLIAVESAENWAPPAGFAMLDSRTYGDSRLSFLIPD